MPIRSEVPDDMREQAVTMLAKLSRYKELMNEAQKIKDELYEEGWLIHRREDGEYGMFNMRALKKELDKQKEM